MGKHRMKRPANRMESPETLPEEPEIRQSADDRQPPDEEPGGFPCKYCGAVRRHRVINTYPPDPTLGYRKRRVYRCDACQRRFENWQALP